MDSPEKDYTHKSWMAVAALIAVLAAMSFIPPHSIGGVKLRRANILSDLYAFDDAPSVAEEAVSSLFDEEDFRVDMLEVAERIADTLPRAVQTTFFWDTAADARPETNADSIAAACGSRRAIPDTALLGPALIPIEEPDTAAVGIIHAFCDTLLNARRPVRIAVMGDSFIEGDILTADLREKLQQTYGGGGPGFAPMASPLTAFRRTVKTQSKGWTSYNIMQRKATPASLRSNFYVSGWLCQPAPGASTRWEMTDYRQRLDSCTAARILFVSPRDSRIEVMLNDTLRREFAVAGNAAVRQIVVRAPHIHALSFRVLSGTEGFAGYGAVFEGDGVVVDNYSVRSNNGQAMFWTNPSVNAQINALTGYDLVILQYGLNIMQTGVKDYRGYAAQIEKMIAFTRECFPGAAVLVLGVSDRSVKTDGGFAPMDAIEHMLRYQRQAAINAGAAFWSTCDAMRAEGGMERFVKNGWAGKDFTHINYAGGKRVAWALYDALNAGARRIYEREQIERRQNTEQALLDSVRRSEIDRRLLPAAAKPIHTPLQ